MNEVYHYPYLCVGWFGLFVTALNLIPIGQLDGGHIARAMFKRNHNLIGQVSLIVLAVMGTLGILPAMGVDFTVGWVGWLIWGILLAVAFHRRRLESSPIEDEMPLGTLRLCVGWFSVLLFILSFTPTPFAGLG
jgi:membrane-associated protease RseP (regulator of RpoE activity)